MSSNAGHDDSARREGSPLPGILKNGPPEVPMIAVFGDIPDKILTITKTMMSVFVGVGRNDETQDAVLVPYVEARFSGFKGPQTDEQDDDSPVFSELISFENTAFWVYNLAVDMKLGARHIADLTGGETRPERARLEVARFFMAAAAREAITATRILNDMLETYPTAPHEMVHVAEQEANKAKKRSRPKAKR